MLDDLTSGRVSRPLDFLLKLHIPSSPLCPHELAIWMPLAPPGFVALGCVASQSGAKPPLTLSCCVRMDLLARKACAGRPVCTFAPQQAGQKNTSVWPVANQVWPLTEW